MKHRCHKDFPRYRFYRDGRIFDKQKHRFLKRINDHLKIFDKCGKRRTVYKSKMVKDLFPISHPKVPSIYNTNKGTKVIRKSINRISKSLPSINITINKLILYIN